LKDVSAKLFKAQKFKKAEKIYTTLNHFFRGNDSRNNFTKENEQEVDYRDATDELEVINKVNRTNLALCYLKQKKLEECIGMCDKALEVDNKHIKAIFLKGRAYFEKQDYK
jgi:tetratricopeptide (TPR) repeat protein